METKIFKTLDELHDEWEKNGACQAGKEFNYSCKSLEEVFRNCPLRFRLWRLRKGYLQFAEHCDWSKLDGYDWYKLLIEQPKFAEHCDWEKINGDDWEELLSFHPQFAKFKKQ